MTVGFEVCFISDSSHEKLIAEISFNNQLLCQINKENGDDKTEIEFFMDFRVLPENPVMKFSLQEFICLLKATEKELVLSD